jgi:hypothetical protein
VNSIADHVVCNGEDISSVVFSSDYPSSTYSYLSFDGIDDYTESQNITTGSSFYFKSRIRFFDLPADDSGDPNYDFFGQGNGQWSLNWAEENQELRFSAKTSSDDGGVWYNIGAEIEENVWTNIVGVFDKENSLLQIFINGSLVSSSPIYGHLIDAGTLYPGFKINRHSNLKFDIEELIIDTDLSNLSNFLNNSNYEISTSTLLYYDFSDGIGDFINNPTVDIDALNASLGTISDWGLVGSATPNGWNGPDIEIYQTGNQEFAIYTQLNDGEIKFRLNEDWNNNYGDNGNDGTLDSGGDNIAVSAGTYYIVMDLSSGTYSITPFNYAGITSQVYGGAVWGSDTFSEVTYSWSNSNPNIGLAESGTGPIPLFTAINNGTAAELADITVTPNYYGCEGESESFSILVNPSAQVDNQADQVVTSGDLIELVFTTQNTGGTTTYTWTNTDTSIGLAANGTNFTSFTALNSGNDPITATITVTPTFENGGVECVGPSEDFNITVNPQGQVDDIADVIYCNGDTTDEVVFTTQNTGGTTTYDWSSDLDIGAGLSGTGAIPSFTATNIGTSPIIATITVIPIFSNGGLDSVGPSEEFTITVNPSGQVDNPGDIILCNGDLIEFEFTTQNTGGTTTYIWEESTTGPIDSFTAINDGTSPIVFFMSVTPIFENGGIQCVGPSEDFTVTVNPSGQVDNPGDIILCNGDLIELFFTTQNTGGTTTYDWSSDLDIGFGTAGQANINYTAVNTGTSPITATITVTPSFEGCIGPSETFTITVNPTGQVDDPQDQVVTSGDLIELFFTTQNTGGTTTYDWSSDLDIGAGLSGTGDLVFTTFNAGCDPIDATFIVTPIFENGGVQCVGPSEAFIITVNNLSCNYEIIVCENDPQITTFCYESNVDNSYIFTSNDGSNLNLSIIEGQVEQGWDQLIIYDSDGSIIYTGEGNNGDLSGLGFQSSGDNITLEVSEDSSISCLENGYTPITFSVSCVGLSVDEQSIFDFSLHPNPTSDYIYINGNIINAELEAVIFDLSGKQVMREFILDKIDISCLEKGTYLINISDGINNSTHKVIKK